MDKVSFGNGCWIWTGGKAGGGYGHMNIGGAKGKSVPAHRFAFEHFKGKIPEGMQLDHLCRNRACVNPDHLEPVTQRTNTLRAHGEGFCKNGHPRTAENTYTYTTKVVAHPVCRVCRRESGARHNVGR